MLGGGAFDCTGIGYAGRPGRLLLLETTLRR